MLYVTMGKSFEIGYKVRSREYDAHYTWSIVPREKNSLEKITVSLRSEVKYKKQIARTLRRTVS